MRVQSPRSQVQSQRQRKSRAKRSLSSDVGLWTLGFGLSVLLALTGCRRGSDALSEPVSSSPLSVGLSTNFVRVGDVFQLTLTSILPPSDTLAAPDLARGAMLLLNRRYEELNLLAASGFCTDLRERLERHGGVMPTASRAGEGVARDPAPGGGGRAEHRRRPLFLLTCVV